MSELLESSAGNPQVLPEGPNGNKKAVMSRNA